MQADPDTDDDESARTYAGLSRVSLSGSGAARMRPEITSQKTSSKLSFLFFLESKEGDPIVSNDVEWRQSSLILSFVLRLFKVWLLHA